MKTSDDTHYPIPILKLREPKVVYCIVREITDQLKCERTHCIHSNNQLRFWYCIQQQDKYTMNPGSQI